MLCSWNKMSTGAAAYPLRGWGGLPDRLIFTVVTVF